MGRLNIVVPIAGRGSRFSAAGFQDPKPLISIAGKPMIEWVIENIRPARVHQFIFICLKEHLECYPLADSLSALCPGCEILTVSQVTEGAACTVLLARELINNTDPLMIANSDQYVELSVDEYLQGLDVNGADGLIMTFWSDDPKWSYCRLREDDTVSEVVEKEVISNNATVGIYNFARGRDFVASADAMIKRNLRVNGEFYVAPAYNPFIELGARVVTVSTGHEMAGMYGLGTPQDLERFQQSNLYHRLAI